MTTDELLKRVADQQPICVERAVRIPGPTLAALLAEGKPIILSDLMAHPDQHEEMRTFCYAHRLGPGLATADIERWQAAHSAHQLPFDLVAFLRRANGVHLWADLETSRAYFGILPLEEWQPAEEADWAMMFDDKPRNLLVLSYHDNGDYYLVLDTRRSEYWWYDLQDFDHPKRVGTTVAELLDFWWHESAWLDPRRDGVAG